MIAMRLETAQSNVTLPVRRMTLHYDLLMQLTVAVVPAMVLVGFGQFVPAAFCLFLTLGAIIGYHVLSGNGLAAMALAVGAIPVMMLLRGLFVFSALQGLLVAAFACRVLTSAVDAKRVKNDQPLVIFIVATVIYWLASAIFIGDYSANMRMIELSFAAACVFLLAGNRSYAATAMAGIAISAICMAGGLLPHGDRLGISSSDQISIGNPITMGLSTTLVLLLTIADGARWLLMHRRPALRLVVSLLAAMALVLSTSRGSWLVCIVSLVLILLLNDNARKPMLVSLCAGVLAIAILMQTDRGPVIAHYVDNAVSGDASLAKRTTGRADQWESFPRVFNDSPLIGFGPGSGKAVSLKYTLEGKPWHSLYLMVGTELGLFGLVALAALLGALLSRGVRHLRTTGELVPLLGIVCFMIVGVSVSGIDSISGVYLGLGFVACDFSGIRRYRRGVVVESAEESVDANLVAATASPR